MRHLLGCQAGAGVAHADSNRPREGRVALDDHRAVRPVVLDGVEQQVDQHLLDADAVGMDAVAKPAFGEAQGNAALLRLRLDHGAAFEHDLGHRHRLQRQHRLARLDQRQVEDFVDQFQQVPARLENPLEVA